MSDTREVSITADAKEIIKKYYKDVYKKTNLQIATYLENKMKTATLFDISGRRLPPANTIKQIDKELIQTTDNYIVYLEQVLEIKRNVKVDAKPGQRIQMLGTELLIKNGKIPASKIQDIANNVYQVIGGPDDMVRYNYITGLGSQNQSIVIKMDGIDIRIPNDTYTIYTGDIIKLQYKKVANVLLGQMYSNRNEKLDEAETNFQRMQREMIKYSRIIEDINNREKDMTQDDFVEHIAKQMEQLEKYPMLNYVQLHEGILEFETTPIFINIEGKSLIKEMEGKEIPIGRYKAKVNVIDGNITILNKDWNDSDYYPHPHVSRHGNICQGAFANVFHKALKEHDILTIVNIILDFFSEYNGNSPYHHLAEWFEEHSSSILPLYKEEDCSKTQRKTIKALAKQHDVSLSIKEEIQKDLDNAGINGIVVTTGDNAVSQEDMQNLGELLIRDAADTTYRPTDTGS